MPSINKSYDLSKQLLKTAHCASLQIGPNNMIIKGPTEPKNIKAVPSLSYLFYSKEQWTILALFLLGILFLTNSAVLYQSV